MKQIKNYIYNMKHIKIYINEKLHITTKSFYTCYPKTKNKLKKIIIQRIKSDGPQCNLNDIDVSNITDMSDLFNANTNYDLGNEIFKDFNGDISMWDVSNVTDMYRMFNQCEQFNCDLSNWNVSNVKNMFCMFAYCEKFNCDLSHWNVLNVTDMTDAFYDCPITPEWYDKYKWE